MDDTPMDPAGGQPESRDPQFEHLYLTYAPLLHRIATRKFAIPREDAETLVHDIFATYLTHSERVHDVYPYLIGGICNAAHAYWHQGDGEPPLFCGATPCKAMPDQALLDEVARTTDMSAALARVDASCRETLRRYYRQGESLESLAASHSLTREAMVRLLVSCRANVLVHYAQERKKRAAAPPRH